MKTMQKLLTAIPVLTLLFLSGCATSGGPFVEGSIEQDIRFSKITQENYPHKEGRVLIYGEDLHVRKVKNPGEGVPPFVFYRFEDMKEETNMRTGKVELVSKKRYVPKRVTVECKDKSKKVCYAVAIKLKTEREGKVPGIKVKFKKSNPDNLDSRYLGYSMVTNQSDSEFGLFTIEILERKYFYPKTEEKRGELDFYIIEKEGFPDTITSIDRKDGSLTIKKPGGIFKFVLLELKDSDKLSSTSGGGLVEAVR